MTNELRPATVEHIRAATSWTTDRVARATDLGRPTPCDAFDLGQLLDHLAESMARFTTVLGGQAPVVDDSESPAARFAQLSRANLLAWEGADMEASYELPIGLLPAPFVAQINLAEVVVHGWDVSRATGERADVPDGLAEEVLQIGSTLLPDDRRAPAFAPAQPGGVTPSDRMAAFYGRRI